MKASTERELVVAIVAIIATVLIAVTSPSPASAQTAPPEQTSPAKPVAQSPETSGAKQKDPFADLDGALKAPEPIAPVSRSWRQTFFKENFGFRKEVMSEFDTNENGEFASRQSVGFEVLKKFSTATSTVASFDFQGRLVRRDGFNPVLNDMEGASRGGWVFEYHNLYLDVYNALNPLLSEEQRKQSVGRFNFRAGRFYVPFGLNLQTDTHGTVLQLSNERNFGFERDWYAGLWGSVNKHINYDAYYLVGSGYDLKYKGQSGLGALRLSLSNKYLSEYGFEGGVSLLGGERLSPQANERVSTMPALSSPREGASKASPMKTERAGVDSRYRHTAPKGLFTITTELSGGRDASDPVFGQLHEAEYLHASRRWGVATQYRRFRQDAAGADASIIAEVSCYFRNDVGNSNSHWLKLNIERQTERIQGPPHTVVTLQYYVYR